MSFRPDPSGGGGSPAGANKSVQYNNGGSFGGVAIGGANKVFGVDAAGTGYEFKTVAGTSNQITVTHGAGTITLSTPQNIHTAATPTFGGLTLAGTQIFSAGAAITGANYETGRDNSGTNQLYANVPTGAGFLWTINAVTKLTIDVANGFYYTRASGAQVRFQEGAGAPSSNSAQIYIAPNNVVTGAFFYCTTSLAGIGTYSNGYDFTLSSSNIVRQTIGANGHITLNQNVGTSSGAASNVFLTCAAANNTNLTASTELSQFIFTPNTQSWGTGALTIQRFTQFQAATVAFTAASTLSDAIGVDFADVVAGTNATITRGVAVRTGNIWLNGGQRIKGTDVNSATYTVLQTDFALEVRYTSTGAQTTTLPAISTVGNGKEFVVIDSGYNALVNNITVARTGGDKINNVAGSYTIGANGRAVTFKSNSTTSNWEIISIV